MAQRALSDKNAGQPELIKAIFLDQKEKKSTKTNLAGGKPGPIKKPEHRLRLESGNNPANDQAASGVPALGAEQLARPAIMNP